MKGRFDRWTSFVIQAPLFLLLLSACGRLLKLEFEGWVDTRATPVTFRPHAGID